MTTLRIALLFIFAASLPAATWKAGTAKANITPKQPIWMAGYGGRNKEGEGGLVEEFVTDGIRQLVRETP